MAIEVWSSDADGRLALMPESPDPHLPHGEVAPAPPPTPEPAPGPEAALPDAPESSQADELRALRRMAEEQKQEAARQSGQMDAVTRMLRGEDLAPPADQKPAEVVRPRSQDFASFEEYEEARDTYFEALADRKAEQKAEEKIAALRQEQHQVSRRVQLETATAQAETAFEEEHADYKAVVSTGFVSQTPDGFREFFMQVLGPKAPAVAYHLSKEPALRDRLVRMPREVLTYSLGELGATVGASAPPAMPAPPQGSVSQAPVASLPPVPGSLPTPAPAGRPKPAPPTPLGGAAVRVSGGYHDGMSQAEYRAYRAAGGQ